MKRNDENRLVRWWRSFWLRAPRQLTFTRDGKVMVAIALAVGAAAINTGNNLLLLGWGLVISSIVLSGVLSEATLKPLEVDVSVPRAARAGELALVPVGLSNAGRFPSFGVETLAEVESPGGVEQAFAQFQLRIASRARADAAARYWPSRRGRHRIGVVIARTLYPFGFFRKSRRFAAGAEGGWTFWVAPRRVETERLARDLLAQVGEDPAARQGIGEDYFSLRPFRTGDDPRRVHWRRSARTGRWVVVETEARQGMELMLELHQRRVDGADDPELEHAVAVLGSLAEDLLAAGLKVGLRAPGLLVPPAVGPRQRQAVMLGLARLDLRAELPPPLPRKVVRVLLGSGPAPAGIDHVLSTRDVQQKQAVSSGSPVSP